MQIESPPNFKIIEGECTKELKKIESNSIQCCVTSPPYYGLRDYHNKDQIGLEDSPEQYIENLVSVFAEVHKVLKKDGTLWLNIGDTYSSGGRNKYDKTATRINTKENLPINGLKRNSPKWAKPKDLLGIPWMLAFALRNWGWYLRSDIIWHKPNPMPESVTDRPTKSHEYLFLFSKSEKYYYDQEAVKVPAQLESIKRLSQDVENQKGSDRAVGKTNGPMKTVGAGMVNRKSVWTIPTTGTNEAHFATFPEKLVEPCILAGSAPGDLILDPFSGTGTAGKVALQLGRSYIGIELNPEYVKIHKNKSYQIGLAI